MIGKLFALGEVEPFKHPRTWAREATSGPERLRVGGGPDSVELLGELSALLAEPLFVLVVLMVPRGHEPGRYESGELSRLEVLAFLRDFHDFFTDDARAEIWIGRTEGPGTLVLDDHDLLYVYGPLDAASARLSELGFTDGMPAAPDPHEHHFNSELDGAEQELVEVRRWRRVLPLQDQDKR